jgi:hypothetical protein
MISCICLFKCPSWTNLLTTSTNPTNENTAWQPQAGVRLNQISDIKQITPLLFTFFATVYSPSFVLNEDGRIKENQPMTLHYQF